jgi:hypothetical protein
MVGASSQEETDDQQITTEGLDPISRQESEQLDIDPGISDSVPSRTNRRFRISETQERANFDLDKPTQNFQKNDPLRDAPNLIWYYRNKDQRERGPLKVKAIQTELSEGKILPGSLVWREDWHAWLPVEQVFPSLFPPTVTTDVHEPEGHAVMVPWTFDQLKKNPRYLRWLILLVGIVLTSLIATAAWLVLNST